MSEKRLRRIFIGLSVIGTGIGLMAVGRSYMSGDIYRGTEEMYGTKQIKKYIYVFLL